MSTPQSYEAGKYNMVGLPSVDQLGDLPPVSTLACWVFCNLIWGLTVIAIGECTAPLHSCTLRGFFFYIYLLGECVCVNVYVCLVYVCV